jgi:hypothetical protein
MSGRYRSHGVQHVPGPHTDQWRSSLAEGVEFRPQPGEVVTAHGLRGLDFCLERATGIEPAFSAWEAERRGFRDLLESAKVLVRGYVGGPAVTAITGP